MVSERVLNSPCTAEGLFKMACSKSLKFLLGESSLSIQELPSDPTIGVGSSAPVGSIAVTNTGAFWQKIGVGDNDWSQIAAAPKRRHVFSTSFRWYSRDNNRFYGPSNAYGPNYYQWNRNHGNNVLSPNFSSMGFVCPWDGNIISAKFQYRRSSTSPTMTAYLVRNRKTFGTSGAVNVQVGSDLVIGSGNTGEMDEAVFDLATNTDFLEGDHLIPLLTSDVNTTYYLYSSLEIVIEEN